MPTYKAILKAAERLKHEAVRTPLLESNQLNAELGCRLLVKAECLQRTGAFKFRGAYNAIRALKETLGEAMQEHGVIAYSSGNHAQAVAMAATLNGLRSTIVMPADAPSIKLENTRANGATVVTYDRLTESREGIAAEIEKKTGGVLIPPFDHPEVMAGQGTVGLEIVEQCREKSLLPDFVLVPCSGGGLVAGTGIAIKENFPKAQIYAIEPEGYNDTQLSLQKGARVKIQPAGNTLCDSLLMTEPGILTFEINRKQLAGALTVTDEEAMQAMASAAHHFKLVLEPGGATALAAVLSGKLDVKGRTVVVVASGGNVSPDILARALRGQGMYHGISEEVLTHVNKGGRAKARLQKIRTTFEKT